MPSRRSPEPIDLPALIAHGSTSGYRYGCGCPPCKAAHNDAEIDRLGDRRAAAAVQLGLFGDDDPAIRTPLRKIRLGIPDDLDLDAVAAALDDPDDRWRARARCAGRQDLAEVFFAEVVAQVRYDGTVAWSAPGDYVPEHWQGWCAGCPVRAECVAAGLAQDTTRYRIGYWGSTPAQRSLIHSALRTRRATA